MEKGVTLERAIELACKTPLDRRTEIISLDSALNRILANDLISKVHDPPFDNSSMDGWAVKHEDCNPYGTKLKIVGTSQAGKYTSIQINHGEACRIMTGAPMPRGSDAIVIIEDTEVNDNNVIINGPARKEYIRKSGENISKGEITLISGSVLSPSSISLSATMGYQELEVVCKPKIAIISNGDELIQPGLELLDGQIYESNSFGIAALVEKMGGEPIRFGVVQDTIEGLRIALNEGANTCDAILTSGGVSMGDWDLVRKIMEEEGNIKFWRVLMRPGGPPLFGKWKNKPIFGLPGNPVSSHVVFTVLVAPWISFSLGVSKEYDNFLAHEVSVILEDPVSGAPGKLCLRRIKIINREGQLVATTHTHQGSGNIHSMVAHNGLTLLPPDSSGEVGDRVNALWFR